MIQLARQSDVLVHEATLENAFEEKAVGNGHSTPRLACAIANKIGAKCLILNHFSQRYKPIGFVSESEEADEQESNVQRLLDEAKDDFEGELYAAYDLFSYKF